MLHAHDRHCHLQTLHADLSLAKNPSPGVQAQRRLGLSTVCDVPPFAISFGPFLPSNFTDNDPFMKHTHSPNPLPTNSGANSTPLHAHSPSTYVPWRPTFQPPLGPNAYSPPGPHPSHLAPLYLHRQPLGYKAHAYHESWYALAPPHGYRVVQNPPPGEPQEPAPRATCPPLLPQARVPLSQRDHMLLPSTLSLLPSAGGATDPDMSVGSSGVYMSAAGPDKPRIRVNKACERCRLHKIKCSGWYPCTNCRKHDLTCRYRTLLPMEAASKTEEETSSLGTQESNSKEATEAPSGLEVPFKRLKTQPRDAGACGRACDDAYVRHLEEKVRQLESTVSQASFHGIEKQQQPSQYKLDDIVVLQRPTSNAWRLCRRYQGALAIELCLALYKGLSPEAQAQVLVPRTNYFGFNMSGCHYLQPEQLPSFPETDGLTNENSVYLVDFFFREINPLYAVLHESVFREQYKAYQGVLLEKQPTNNVALFSAMLCLVLALGIRFTEFVKPAGPDMHRLLLEEKLFKYAHKVVLIFSAEWESFELIQCWLLCTLYLRVSHRQTSCHLSLGKALSMCRSMGLGKYEQIPHDCSPYELAKAKRIFYAVYSFDRIIGLQGGRISGMAEEEITRSFPRLDYDGECGADDWVTLPAFAMLHVARLAHYLNLAYSNSHDLVTAGKMVREFDELRAWLDANGFNDETDIFELESDPRASHMVKAQVKLHFYELTQCIHAKTLFSIFGHRVSIEGMRVGTILQCNKEIVYLLKKVLHSGSLYAPWYLTLQLVLTVGVNSLVFVNSGIHVVESRRLIKDIMTILQVLRNSPVYDASGALLFKLRFKMVEECHWLFKMMSHIMALHYEESLRNLNEFGTDHGSRDVNMSTLVFDNSAHVNQSLRSPGAEDKLPSIHQEGGAKSVPEEPFSQPLSPGGAVEVSVDEYAQNLAWFDKWLD